MVLSGVILAISFVFYQYIGVIYSKSLTALEIEYGKKIFSIVTLYLIASFLTEAFNGVIQGFEQFLFSKVVVLAKLILRTIIVLVLFMWSPHAVTLAFVDFSVSLIYVVVNAVYCRQKFSIRFRSRYFDLSIVTGVLPYAFALLIQSIVNQANNNVDKFLIGILMKPANVTVYSIGLFIYSSYSSMSVIPISLYLPQIVMDVTNGIDNQQLTRSVVAPSRLITAIGGSILFAFIAIGKKFICVFYGTDYIDSYYVALIIMIPMFINMTTGILINVLDAKGKRLSRSIVLLATTIANIVLTLIFIPIWGIIGAAIATAICTMLGQVLVMNIFYKRVIGIDIELLYRESFHGLLVAMVFCCIVVFPISRLLPNDVWAIAVECFIYVVLFVVCLMSFGMSKGEKQMVIKKIGLRNGRVQR